MSSPAPTPPTITVLTRPGCPGTPTLRARLAGALLASGLDLPCAIVDISTLAELDLRRAWPTPTVLVDGRDLFGMEAPAPGQPPT